MKTSQHSNKTNKIRKNNGGWNKFISVNTQEQQADTRLVRHTTGHMEQPSVQQQHKQPHSNHFIFIGSVFFRTPFIRFMEAANSSGATCYIVKKKITVTEERQM